jgi:hypothetical protein
VGINTVGRVRCPVAVTVALAGIGFVALHSQPRLGWWLIGCGLVVALGAAVVDGCKLGMHRRKLREARRIEQTLRGHGDRFYHQPFDAEAVERWRASIGRHMGGSPFKPGTADRVLTQYGNRFSDPLERLRRIEDDIERHIE